MSGGARIVDVVTYDGGTTWQASINGRVKVSGAASATAAMIAVAKLYPPGTTLNAPKVMSQPMKAGDIVAQQSIAAASFPAYTSSFQ